MTLLLPLLILALPPADEPTAPPKLAPPRHSERPEADVIWHLTLAEAIRIGLQNSEVIRVVTPRPGAPLPAGFTPLTPAVQDLAAGGKGAAPTTARPDAAHVAIARADGDGSIWDFQAAVAAHVRSVEQQYWALSQQQIALWARETAARLGEEILRRERAERKEGRSSDAEVAEAVQHLENFRLNLVTATSDLATTERQLRNILGLPAADGRRIVPATAPTEAEVKPDWDACVKQMMAGQPDVAQQRQLITLAALRTVADPAGVAPTDEQRTRVQREAERQRLMLQQVVHQATHTLSRFFLEVDVNYKQFRTAQRLRAAAQLRLEAQRAFQEEGKITIDRLLDAVGQYANAIAQEAQYKTSYNTSLVALEEAKGTLLAFDGITVVLEPGPSPREDKPAPAPAVAPAPAPASAATYKVRASVVGIHLFDVEVQVDRPAPPVPK